MNHPSFCRAIALRHRVPRLGLLLLSAVAFASTPRNLQGQRAPEAVVGSWIGDSRCVGTSTTCHDEHVLYRIDTAGRGAVVLRGARITGRDTVDMGDLSCASDNARSSIACAIPAGTWRFWVTEHHLEGSLTLRDSTVMRRVLAQRVPPA